MKHLWIIQWIGLAIVLTAGQAFGQVNPMQQRLVMQQMQQVQRQQQRMQQQQQQSWRMQQQRQQQTQRWQNNPTMAQMKQWKAQTNNGFKWDQNQMNRWQRSGQPQRRFRIFSNRRWRVRQPQLPTTIIGKKEMRTLRQPAVQIRQPINVKDLPRESKEAPKLQLPDTPPDIPRS